MVKSLLNITEKSKRTTRHIRGNTAQREINKTVKNKWKGECDQLYFKSNSVSLTKERDGKTEQEQA